MTHAAGMYIDGSWLAGSGTRIDVANPATGETVGSVPAASEAEVDAALQAARKAFPDWAKSAPAKRAGLLKRAAALVAERAEDMGRTMTSEQGKPLNEAIGEVRKLAGAFSFYAEEATRIHGAIVPNDSTAYQSLVLREPVGVVAAITPWNYPAELIGWKLAAGLAAGCTIVVKPPILAPLCPLEIAACLHDAGVPRGVANMVTGPGGQIGRQLVESPLVDKIAFTGSSEVGLQIQQAPKDIKRISLELGGNCPMIVTPHADFADAVRGAVRRSFRNCGQICIAINRIYVHESAYGNFLGQLAEATDRLVVANGLENPSADLGAMCSAEALAKTKEHLADALAQGARLVAGGSEPQGPEFAGGRFFRPTVVADCTSEMKLMNEETFGPIVGVAPYRLLTDAIGMANDTPYGLASYAYTRDTGEIRLLSRDLDYGNVAINNVDAGIMNAPYGGRKQSGVGVEHGREGLLEYLQFKHVRLRFADEEPD